MSYLDGFDGSQWNSQLVVFSFDHRLIMFKTAFRGIKGNRCAANVSGSKAKHFHTVTTTSTVICMVIVVGTVSSTTNSDGPLLPLAVRITTGMTGVICTGHCEIAKKRVLMVGKCPMAPAANLLAAKSVTTANGLMKIWCTRSR
ncbi:uncharacterized protein LOC112598109 isoform X2 [Melanaphis sacchari]|uniref:uncharacterized protein LOC112598109 isoform X2 n=1 Tax=Melanaphis sacchari TaxID=742174 RepID=UPI000DC13556|nr:uncharacterized protein LOC112598109 isoform X2 [Melanaphis sacchari]